MFCSKCGNSISNNDKFCIKCGTRIDNLLSNSLVYSSDVGVENSLKNRDKIKSYKLFFIVVGISFVLLMLVLFFTINLFRKDRSEILTTIDENSFISFKLEGKQYFIGDRVKKLTVNGLKYDSNFVQKTVYSDSITTRTFINNNENEMFLGALYCSKVEDCKYDETILVKANFYQSSNVLVNNTIKFGMSYEEVVENYGKEDGRFYQDKELYVWTFGDKNVVGDPYMVLRFDEGGWLSWGGINEIRLGVFWYEGEADHIIVSAESEVKE